MSQAQVSQSPQAMALQGIDISPSVFDSTLNFIQAVQEGLSGVVVKQAIGVLGHRELFVDILGVQSANLSRVYRRKRLDKTDSESVLDVLRVVSEATRVFESRERADEWLATPLTALGGHRPIDLCDTFEGRDLVRSALRKVEFGDFS